MPTQPKSDGSSVSPLIVTEVLIDLVRGYVEVLCFCFFFLSFLSELHYLKMFSLCCLFGFLSFQYSDMHGKWGCPNIRLKKGVIQELEAWLQVE